MENIFLCWPKDLMKPPISHRLWEAQLLKWWGRCGNGVYLTCVCTTRGVKIQPKLSTNVIGWSYIKITSYRSTYNIFADCFLEFLSCWFKNFDFNIGTSYRCKLDYINWSSILNFFFFCVSSLVLGTEHLLFGRKTFSWWYFGFFITWWPFISFFLTLPLPHNNFLNQPYNLFFSFFVFPTKVRMTLDLFFFLCDYWNISWGCGNSLKG